MADATVAAMIDAGQSLVVETVLSSPKYRDQVTRAKAKGFRIGLVYVSLHSPELSPARVNERVQKGGHAVEPAKAIERYHRSHAQLTWFAAQADVLLVFDNSNSEPGPEPVLLATRTPGRAVRLLRRGLNPAVDQALGRRQDAVAPKPSP